MAIVHQYTIIYFTLIVHESMTISIIRDLCLETIARFINHEDKCDFDLSTAVDILQDVTTCPKKCSLRINSLICEDKYSLKGIKLTIGNTTKTVFDSCSLPTFRRRTIFISCSSWNAGEYIHEIRYKAYSCVMNNAQCVHINNNCICHCMPGYILVDDKCLKKMVNIGGICEFDWQCRRSKFGNVCEHDHGLCSCNPGYIKTDRKCYPDTLPVGGFCNLSKQCTGNNNSGVCENGRCTCAKDFTFIDLACKNSSDLPNSLGIESSISQQRDINIGVTLGTLFGGFILGVVVTAVITTLMYRRLTFRTRKREEPDVMFSDNRTYGGANSVQILYRNNKKRDVAKLSPYSFAKETSGYNLSEKQDERFDDVYNHLHEQTEQDDDTYDHACAVPYHNTDLSDYSNIHDAAIFRLSPSKDGDNYSTLRH